jgi:hypothetical protein
MTDADIVTKKLALIETYVRELRELANPAAIVDDVRERRFVESSLRSEHGCRGRRRSQPGPSFIARSILVLSST